MNEQMTLASFVVDGPDELMGPRAAEGAEDKATKRVRLLLCLLPVDVALINLGFSAVEWIRHGRFWSQETGVLSSALVMIYVVCGFAVRAFSSTTLLTRSTSMMRACVSLTLAFTILTANIFLFRVGDQYSQIELAAAAGLCFVLISLWRDLYVSICRRALGGTLYSTLVLNDGSVSHVLHATRGHNIERFFDLENPGPDDYDRLARLLGSVDKVIIETCPERRMAWADIFKGMNVHAEVVAPELVLLQPQGIGEFDRHKTLVIARGPLSLRDRVIKRGFDLAFSLTAIVFLAPLMVVTAIAIKIDSPGPIFFRQPRIGRQNRIFRVYKFRSMYVDQNDTRGGNSTQRGDPRVTRIGRLIRATSIDELPQFLNVMFGDMSVVGPRPHAIHSTAEDLLFWDIDKRYWHRHSCKPGITGLAQVMGLRGATHFKSELTNRVSADLQYTQSWTIWEDFRIVFRTLAVVVHKNAY